MQKRVEEEDMKEVDETFEKLDPMDNHISFQVISLSII